MKKQGLVMRRVCIAIGIALLIGAVVMLALWRWNISNSIKQAQYYVTTLQEIIPKPTPAALEERRDNTMSALSVDGTDFVGLIEMPQYGSVLPVGGMWGESSKYPCCFHGSIYDGTMQIGATTQKGQYDFYRELSVGDSIVYTDMEGNRYTFKVTSLRYEKHADQAALGREEASLTLFIKNIYSFEYLIVFCDVSY